MSSGGVNAPAPNGSGGEAAADGGDVTASVSSAAPESGIPASGGNAPSGGPPAAPGRWPLYMGGAVAGLGMFLGALDFSVNVALPEIAAALNADLQSIQWIIVAMVATRAAIVMGAGSLADRLGLRPVYLWSAAGYLASMVCIVFSPDLATMVGFRFLQATATGALFAVSPAIAARVFPPHRRGLGMGFTAGSQALGMLAGTLGAGLLVGWLGWEAVFWGRVPFVAAALLLAWLYLERPGRERPTTERTESVAPPSSPGDGSRFDLPGAAALLIGLLSLVIGLQLGRSLGWTSPAPLLLLALALALLPVFWRLERRAAWPVLPLELLRVRGFSVSGLTMFLAHFATFVIFFIFPFFIDGILERGPVIIGVMLAVISFVHSAFSAAGGWLIDRAGARPVGLAGLLLTAAGMAYMAFLQPDSGLADAAVRLAVVGMGLGLFSAAAYALMLSSVPAARFSTAAAALSLAQALGAVLAVAIVGGLFALRSDHHLAGLAGMETAAAAEVLAFTHAFREVFLLGAATGLLAAAAYLFSGPKPPPAG